MNELKIKRYDVIIVIILIIFSILPTFLFAAGSYEGSDIYARIYVNGDLYKEIKLGDGIEYDLVITNGRGVNEVSVSGREVYMASANCFDKYCVKQGHISEPGQTIVCLPNRVLIEITGKEKPLIDDISR
jgi:hypothetical protein